MSKLKRSLLLLAGLGLVIAGLFSFNLFFLSSSSSSKPASSSLTLAHVPNFASDSISFQPPTTYATGGDWAGDFAIADFNKDGIPDIAVTNQTGNTVGILLGNGDGTFQPPVSYNIGSADVLAGLAVDDFNGDKKLDLVVVSKSNGKVYVVLGNGSGSFYEVDIYQVGSQPTGAVVGDFNSDGNLDIMVGTDSPVYGFILLGDGYGKFQATITVPPTVSPTAYYHTMYNHPIAVADFNKDGFKDIVWLARDKSEFGILAGLGNGSFQFLYSKVAPNLPSVVRVMDLNGDGKLAIITLGTHNLSVFLNNSVKP